MKLTVTQRGDTFIVVATFEQYKGICIGFSIREAQIKAVGNLLNEMWEGK
jgi:hypothetical protein